MLPLEEFQLEEADLHEAEQEDDDAADAGEEGAVAAEEGTDSGEADAQQEEGKGDKCCQEILSSSHFRKKGYLQRPLTLSVDGSEKAHYEIYECQEKERSRTLEHYRLFHNHLGFYSTEYCFSSGASRTAISSEAPNSDFSE